VPRLHLGYSQPSVTGSAPSMKSGLRTIGHSLQPLAWTTYLLWRAPEWWLFRGIPVGPASLSALFLVWRAWWFGRPRRVSQWIWVLVIGKALIGPALVATGLHASYFTNNAWTSPPERGLYGSWPGETRIDDWLAFGGMAG